MATRPDYMSNAVRPVRPDYMANAVREGEEPPAPTETTGALGVLGDFLVENLGGASATMRENAASGVFARDAAKNEGWLDRAGTLFERGAASIDQGLYNFLGGLGSQKARDAAAVMVNTTGADVAGSTSWEEANSLGSMANFVADAGVESLPAMGALAVPYAGPAIIGTSQTGNIAADRAANDGRNQITAGDLGEAAPWAIASTALDRLGLKGIKNPVGNTVTGRVAGSAMREGLTEAAQSGIEYSGGTVGTEQGFDLTDMGNQMLAGGVAGFGIGGTARGGLEIAQPALSKVNVRTQRNEPVAGTPEADTDGGSLDDYMNAQRPDYMGDAKPLALPSPEMVERQTRTVTPERREEPAEPKPVDDGVAVAQSIFGDAARITSGYRGPDHPLSRANPRSYHTQTRAAVDMAPIEGMTFDEAKAAIEAQGYTLIEAIDETGSGRTRHATGDHWHFVIGTAGRMEPQGGEFDAGDVPGADGSLLGRGSRQESIAGRITIPEAAPVERAEPVELPPAALSGEASQVTTARGQTVDTQYEVRPLSQLIDSSNPAYDQALQPRDRASRATSDAQVAQIAANLDPAQLGDSRLASTGAPIIGPDGMVESGNGRTAAIARAYASNPERAEAYRQMIEMRGFDTAGIDQPVLVRRRTTQMTPEQRQQWTRAANERDTMAMSSTEQATADARSLDDNVLGLYRGGPITAAANRDFVRAFIGSAVSPAERNAMTAGDGSLSVDGIRRIQFALLARAYGDGALIAKIAEDADTNIAAIGKALLQAAPAFARLKAAIASGDVPAQYDISANIAEAAGMVSRSRDSGQSLAGMLAQADAFTAPPPPETVEVLRTIFRDEEFKRPRSGPKVGDILTNYAKEAENVGDRIRQGNDMFGNAPELQPPAEMLRDQRLLIDGDASAQPDMLTNPPEPATVPTDAQANQPAGQPASVRPDQGEPDGGPDSSVPTLAGGQLRALGIASELRTRKAAALVGRTASTPKELAEIAQIYRDPRYETFRIFFTKGDTIVHATGVSSRSIAEAPLMPEGMEYNEFIARTQRTMQESGADGYYLLHNHPSGAPDPSPADKQVTREISSRLEGFRGHVVINSNKFAEIQVDRAGRSQTKIRNLNTGEDNLLKASVPHDALGSKASSGIALAMMAKRLQKPGYVTVIGTSSGAEVRVIVEFDEATVKRDPKRLMGMGRTIMRQSGAASLFLVGDRDILKSPNVSRALQAGMVTAAFDNDGKPITDKVARKNKMPTPPGRYVAEDVADFGDTIEIDGKQRATLNSDGLPIARDEAGIRAFWKWFGDSKVVDAQGRPLVVYHGTVSDIDAFDRSRLGENTQASSARQGFFFTSDPSVAASYAHYAATVRPVERLVEEANAAERRGDWDGYDAKIAEAEKLEKDLVQPDARMRGQQVMPVYLASARPVEIDAKGETFFGIEDDIHSAIKKAKRTGGDGAIFRNLDDDAGFANREADHFLVFKPEQIKSVNNRGTFDPDDARILREDSERFKIDPKPSIIDKLVDRDGLSRDVDAIRNIVGNPVEALKSVTNGGFAEMARAYFYTADSRLRGMAKKYNSEAITQLADMFHAQAGKTDRAVSETYHEAVEREGFGRAGQAWRILEPFFKDKAAMERIGLMLRDPTRRNVTMRKAEKNAAAEIAKLLKDTIDYRKKAGEDIGEVTDGYFPRFMDVEKVVKNRDLFLRQATELYRRHGAENPEASAKAWAARIFDQYAGLDGGLEYASLFRDTRPAGVGRQTTKAREFGKDADTLLGEFYDNDTGSVLTGYFIGAARKAEEARRFGSEATGQEPLQRMMNQIKRDIRASGEDAGDTIEAISRIVSTNLGRISTPPGWLRTAGSVLHTAGQLGTLDRATYTSLSEAMMGFVRAGPKYGIPMVTESARQFARQLRNAPPDKATRMAQFLGIAHDVMVGEALASRNGYEMAQTSRRAQKVQQGFFQATGLHQWTEGTRSAATRIGQQFIADLALDMGGPDAARSGGYLKELGIKDPQAFAQWLNANGDPTPESLTHFSAGPMEEQYRTALVRFVNQTIMKPSRAEKPRWASDPFYGLFFSLLSFSYGFKKNVLDRVGRQGMDAIKTKDPTLLYPALGMAGLFAVHTILQNTLRQAIFGGGREDDEEGISGMDVIEAVDRAGLTGAASRPLNAILSLKYRASVLESMAGPTVGRPAQLIEDVMGLATDANSPNTNTAERKAAGAIYDVVLEPALEAYGVTRFKKPLAAAVVWGTGNRGGAEGGVDGMLPADRDFFVEALAGPPQN